jgi:hypothetical protein
MKRPRTVSDWIGVAVALAGCVAAAYLFGWVLAP